MNVLYLSPMFPPNFVQFPVKLAARGARVIGVGFEPYHELSHGVEMSLVDYAQANLNDYEHVFRTAGALISRHGRIDRVESHQEHWIELECRLREDFNIPGRKYSDMDVIKRKSAMKERLRQAGVPVAPGVIASDRATCEAFIAVNGYPVVVKPDIGVGAQGTGVLRSAEDLAAFLASDQGTEYFMEAFIDGELFSFDGLTGPEGHPVFTSAMVFDRGIMEVVNHDTDMHYYTLREIPPALEALGHKVATAFNEREKFFHYEFFRQRHTGQFIALEINMRPPGGISTDMMNFANDIDIYDGWAEVVTAGVFSAVPSRNYVASHIGRKNLLSYVHCHDEICARYGDNIKLTTSLPPLFSKVLGDYAYLTRTGNESEMLEMIRFVQEKQPCS